MSAFTRKYATATHVYIPIVKRGAVDFALSADWTPAAGDVKVSIDGGAAANIGTLPVAIAMGNGAMWDFTIASGETTGKKIVVTVADAATKAVEDQCFLIETYGHANAEYQADMSAANYPVNVQQWLGSTPNALQSGRVDSYVGAMAAGVIAAATFAANALDAVWAEVTSGLTTAGTIGKLLVDNVNAAISSRLASASYTAPDNATIGTTAVAVAAIKAKTDNLPASPAAVSDIPTAAQNAAGLLDLAAGVETNRTVRQALRLMLAALVGKLSGAATTSVAIRDTNDSKNRISATVDADGNRSAVTLDAS